MSNSNASASDSANIEISRSPLIYPEPVSMIKAVGKFDCKIERVGGLVETFTSYNSITLNGKQQLIYGIAKTNSLFANANSEASRTGMYFSSAITGPTNDDADGTRADDFLATTNIAAVSAGNTIEGTGATGAVANCAAGVFLTKSGLDGIDIFGTAVSTTAKTLTSNAIKVVSDATAGSTIESILLVDASTGVIANARVWCGTEVTVSLEQDDTLEATYTLSIS